MFTCFARRCGALVGGQKCFSTATESLRVLITGGSNGIGKAISDKFASELHHVVSVDVDEAANRELQSQHINIACITKDITAVETPIECVEYMVQHYGGVDILINNAAVQLGNGLPIHEVDEAMWDRTLTVNLTAYYRFSKYVIRQILKQPKGDVRRTKVQHRKHGLRPRPTV